MDMESGSNLSCALCHSILSSDNDAPHLEAEAISVCGDCNFLLLEDFETTSPDVYRRRRGVSRRRFNSSESMESMFSHQFSQMINLAARQNPSNSNSNSVDSGSRSRRWRRVLSDTESDGFDSVYGETESNASSFRTRYRAAAAAVHGEAADSESDAASESLLENHNFGHHQEHSELDLEDSDSDNNIDPMNAGEFQWNSEDESEWEEAESLVAAAQPHVEGNNVLINWRRQLFSPEVVRIRRRIQAASGELLSSLEESLVQNYVGNAGDYLGNAGDYLDARGFEDLLDHLAENDISSRRGAPPASVSYINNMPCVTINEDEKLLVCAICKDSFTVGIVVNQLPCSHLYHPACILPWLSARNTCPLCRYELPIDDDKERSHEIVDDIHELELLNEDSSSSLDDDDGDDDDDQLSQLVDDARGDTDSPRNRWFFLAAPIVSIIGISLILLFGDSSAAARLCPSNHRIAPFRRENNQRRWWSFF